MGIYRFPKYMFSETCNLQGICTIGIDWPNHGHIYRKSSAKVTFSQLPVNYTEFPPTHQMPDRMNPPGGDLGGYSDETSLSHMSRFATEARVRKTAEWISGHVRAERQHRPLSGRDLRRS